MAEAESVTHELLRGAEEERAESQVVLVSLVFLLLAAQVALRALVAGYVSARRGAAMSVRLHQRRHRGLLMKAYWKRSMAPMVFCRKYCQSCLGSSHERKADIARP
jgi:hypothetical protein